MRIENSGLEIDIQLNEEKKDSEKYERKKGKHCFDNLCSKEEMKKKDK